MKKLPKHHYIPVFYLKEWAAIDGRLIEFSRPYGNVVKPRHTHPDGTGYVRGLYRLPGLPDDLAEMIETKFFKRVDDYASYAHKKLMRKYMINWSPRMRTAWTYFIISTLIRSPKTVADTKLKLAEGLPELWEKERQRQAEEDPTRPSLGDYDKAVVERTSIIALQRFINNESLGNFINNMIWTVCDVSPTKYRLLTSDRPIVMTNGLGYKESHLAVPVSPTILFLAANNDETIRAIQSMSVKELVSNCNKQVVRNAVKYVWAPDHSQSRLITSQLSSEAHNDRTWFREYKGPERELVPGAKQVVI
jgi:uncharacterized protein DUF4238